MTQSVGIDAADALLELAVREIWTLFIFLFFSFLLYANRESQPLHLLLMFAFKKKKDKNAVRRETMNTNNVKLLPRAPKRARQAHIIHAALNAHPNPSASATRHNNVLSFSPGDPAYR